MRYVIDNELLQVQDMTHHHNLQYYHYPLYNMIVDPERAA